MARLRKAGSRSAGYHYDATPKNPRPTKTPVKAPPKGMAAKSPAGDYRGAAEDFDTAVATLPASARVPTERASAPYRRKAKAARKQKRQTRRVRRAAAYHQRVEDRRKAAPDFKPSKLLGLKTAGTPTTKELAKATVQGKLQVDEQGALTTPKVRVARKKVAQAKKIVRRSSNKALTGMTHDERETLKDSRSSHSRHPALPIPVGMAQVKQESGFRSDADSNADAHGRTQFIPGTAAAYGVKYGTGRPEEKSQVEGQYRYMEDLIRQNGGNVTAALNDYLGVGGTAPSDYSSNILAMAAEFKGAAKPLLSKGQRAKIRKANAAAKKAGVKGVQGQAPATAAKVGPAPKKLVTRFKAAKVAMKEVEGTPYVLGGGHGAPHSEPTGGALDCSGAVGYVLNKIGAMSGSATSGEMGAYLKPGPGLLTVFYNDGHTFLRLGNEYWGTSVGDSGAGGLTRHPAPSADYLAQYSVGHVPGMGKKQALQMGFTDLGGDAPTSFPGMTLSDGGATATIDQGAGATKKGKPGFSKSPIKLTPAQKARRTFGKLKRMGLGVGEKPSPEPAKGTELTRLEREYGKAAV